MYESGKMKRDWLSSTLITIPKELKANECRNTEHPV